MIYLATGACSLRRRRKIMIVLIIVARPGPVSLSVSAWQTADGPVAALNEHQCPVMTSMHSLSFPLPALDYGQSA